MKKYMRWNAIYSKEYHTKNYAKRMKLIPIFRALGMIDCYISGTAWVAKWRKWHPVNWIFFLVVVLVNGIANWKDIKNEMFYLSEYDKIAIKHCNLKNAPQIWDKDNVKEYTEIKDIK